MNKKNKMKYKNLFILVLTFLISQMLSGQNPVKKIPYPFIISNNLKLATDIYYQDTTNSYPVVFMRTPYPRKQYSFTAEYFANQGYIVIVQNVRGTGGSSGSMLPFVNENEDGLAMLDAITSKKWCNGSIGMFGPSYNSFCGLILGASKHPSLKALVNIGGWIEPSVIAQPAGVNHIMMNIPWMLFNYTNGKLVPGKYNADSVFSHVPINTVLKNFNIDILFEEMKSAIENLNKDFSYKDFDVPVCHVIGMYDFTKEGTFNLYDSLRKFEKKQRIIIGPWIHDQVFNRSNKVGDWELAKPGYDSITSKILRSASNWFKIYLKKEQVSALPPEIHAMPVFSESFNLNARKYPVDQIKQVNYFLAINKDKRNILQKSKPNIQESVSFVSDPNNPVPTEGGANFHFFPDNVGLKKQNKTALRNDVLTFTSDKLNTQLWGVGKAKVKLYASNNSKDCDFTAKLSGIDPDENVWIIADGITRLSKSTLINTQKKDNNGQTIYEFEIDLGHIAFILKPQWRIRLDIAGSNFPKYDRNPGNGDDPLKALFFYKTTQTIFTGGNFYPYLSLDILD
jgi:uncharacterized protein